MYIYGFGVPKDEKQALKWFKKSAESGYGHAQFNLALMYMEGKGTPQDKAKAWLWMKKAAAQGQSGALFYMGVTCRDGDGIRKDTVKALMYMDLAVDRATKWDNQGDMLANRQALAKQMTPAQIAEAKRLAAEWKPVKPVQSN